MAAGGGGNAWDSFAYDPELNLVYIGTGNGSPHMWHFRSEGKGDNLFLCSIVAVDATTGEYKWHYQQNPGETWDFTATQQMTLADLTIDGQLRKVVMQAPKNGFFYLVDRTNGKLISAEAYAEQNWAERIDLETGRPVEIPASRYENEPYLVIPSGIGAHACAPVQPARADGQAGTVCGAVRHLVAALVLVARYRGTGLADAVLQLPAQRGAVPFVVVAA